MIKSFGVLVHSRESSWESPLTICSVSCEGLTPISPVSKGDAVQVYRAPVSRSKLPWTQENLSASCVLRERSNISLSFFSVCRQRNYVYKKKKKGILICLNKTLCSEWEGNFYNRKEKASYRKWVLIMLTWEYILHLKSHNPTLFTF